MTHAKGFFIALGLALVVALGLAVWLLGRDRLMTLGLIFVIGLDPGPGHGRPALCLSGPIGGGT